MARPYRAFVIWRTGIPGPSGRAVTERAFSPAVVASIGIPHLRHADAIEIGDVIRGGSIGVTGRAGVADNIALDSREGRWQISRALEVIQDATDALPGDRDATGVVGCGWRQHDEDGGWVGGVQAGDPILIHIKA